MEDDHPVADALDLGQQVRVEDDRGAAIPGRADDGADIRPTDRVERRGRLIEQDQLRVAEQRDAKAEALLHALREPADRVSRAIREPDPIERLVDRGRVARGGQACEPGVQREHLAGRQPRLVPKELGQVADLRARRAIAERCPRTLPDPRVGRARPSSSLIAVVLPAPLGPRRPTSSPRPTVRLSPSSAVVRPKVLTIPSSSMTGVDPSTGAAGSSRRFDATYV